MAAQILVADYTLADVALNIERLDMTFLRRSLSKHACGVALLPHPVQLEDAATDPGYRYSAVQQAVGYRTIAAVPMVRETQAIGVIATWRLGSSASGANGTSR